MKQTALLLVFGLSLTLMVFGCSDDGGGGGGTGGSGGGSVGDPIGVGSGTTAWRAVPKACVEGVYDNTTDPTQPSYTCTIPPDPPIDIPGGGVASAISDGPPSTSVYAGCEVPSETLMLQLAMDTVVSLDASSTGDGNLKLHYKFLSSNPALPAAGPLASLVDVTIATNIATGVPSQLTTPLLEEFKNTPVGDYVQGNDFILEDELDDTPQAVGATSSPSVAVNFASNEFLVELVINSSGAPLNIDASSCAFDNPAGTCIGGVNSLQICDPSEPGGGPGGADCTATNPMVQPGTCVNTDGADIILPVSGAGGNGGAGGSGGAGGG